jgi:hypothetical protein
MSKSRIKRIECLKKRAEHLRKRIEERGIDDPRGSFDKAEMNALLWALPILEGHMAAHFELQRQLFKDNDGF